MSPSLPSAGTDRLSTICKGLAHPARVRIVRSLLRTGTSTCGALVETCGLAQSTVSQHLAVLARSGLVCRDRSGYRIAPHRLTMLRVLVAAL